MLVSLEEVLSITGRDIDDSDVLNGAQALIESYIGRTEIDVINPRDLALMARAVAFQAVYMHSQQKMIYEQVPVKNITIGGTSYTFPDSSTGLLWLSPIAKTICDRLSWTRTRSVKTGRATHPELKLLSWWTED